MIEDFITEVENIEDVQDLVTDAVKERINEYFASKTYKDNEKISLRLMESKMKLVI